MASDIEYWIHQTNVAEMMARSYAAALERQAPVFNAAMAYFEVERALSEVPLRPSEPVLSAAVRERLEFEARVRILKLLEACRAYSETQEVERG